MCIRQKIEDLICNNMPLEAEILVKKELEQDYGNAELHFLHGRICTKLGKRAEAIGAFSKAVSLDPKNAAYETAYRMSVDIEEFFNHDLLNP